MSTSNNPHDLPREIEDALALYFDNQATSEVCQTINDWLEADPKNAAMFAEYGTIERMIYCAQKHEDASAVFALLQEMEQASEEELVVADEHGIPLPAHAISEQSSLTPTKQDWAGAGRYLYEHYVTPRALWAIGAAAAVVLLAALAIVFLPAGNNTPQDIVELPDLTPVDPIPDTYRAVATITEQFNATWVTDNGEGAMPDRSLLGANQRLTLTQGFAEVTTLRGAKVLIQAPATIETTTSDNAIRLHRGKLVGLCHDELAKGFVIETQYSNIIDLGTEFGVTVHAEGVEATVFSGEVAFVTPKGVMQSIVSNQSARLTAINGTIEFTIEDKLASGYIQRLPRATLITEANINLPDFKAEVLPNSAYEDAKLYSDCNHELNGLDAEGLPSILIGGDIVRMPATARPDISPSVKENLELEIVSSAPADIYILIPDGSVTGDWLRRDYVNTGLLTGLDLSGRTSNKHFDYGLGGIGPGVSIDRPMEVWKRKNPVIGRTIVSGTISGSMYGVIVVPKHDEIKSD